MTRTTRTLTTAAALILGAGLGVATMACIAATDAPETPDQPGLIVTEQPAETPLPELPPCPTEDSTGCYWDADVQGNQAGTDVVTQPEYPTEGMPEDFDPETDSTAPIEVPYDGRWDTVPGDVLACGPDAAPAIDYNDVWGWWAYCEPAMLNDDGTLWDGR